MAADGTNETPVIAGFEYIKALGSGGFSDVLLYQQKLPRRKVAVKVLHVETLDRQTRRQFVAEANLMAQLSSHPAIATIYSADITEAGAPYLVMEYCSGGSLGASYRVTPMSPAEVLNIGVRMSAAIEAAHRLGIIHRDIKPANILITDYGSPVLTDFGISVGDDGVSEATMFQGDDLTKTATTSGTTHGMSVPWAPPEAFLDEPISDERSDIFSLGATLYSLLEGRTPFELENASNAAVQLSRRIEKGEITPAKREAEAPSLMAVMKRAMATLPSDRFQSALELAQALQAVQRELGLAETPIELPVIDGDTAKNRADAAAAVVAAAPATEPDATLTTLAVPQVAAPASPAAVLPPDAGAGAPVPPVAVPPAYVAAAAPPAQQQAGQPDPSLYAAYPVAPAPKKKMGVALIAVITAVVVVGIGVAGVFGVSAIVNYVNGSSTTSNNTSDRNNDDDDEDEDEPDPDETDGPVVTGDVPFCDDTHMDYASQIFGIPVEDIQSLDEPGDPVALSSDVEPYCGYQIVDAPDYSSHIIQVVYFEGTEENAQAISDAYAADGFECSDPNVYESLTGYNCSGLDYGMSMYLYKEAYGDEAPAEFEGGPYIDLTTYIFD
jgi:tRNA A-37 threonylcarbamoyl transferase component Bud32